MLYLFRFHFDINENARTMGDIFHDKEQDKRWYQVEVERF